MDDGKGRDAKILNDITQYFKISRKRTMQWIMEGARCNIKISITKDIQNIIINREGYNR